MASRDTFDSCLVSDVQPMRAAAKDQAELLAISYADRIDLTYGSDQEMEKAYRQFVSGWMFGSFGLRPAIGGCSPKNDDRKPGAHPYAVLSYDYWTRRFGQDPKARRADLPHGRHPLSDCWRGPERFTGTETGTVTDIFVPDDDESRRSVHDELSGSGRWCC